MCGDIDGAKRHIIKDREAGKNDFENMSYEFKIIDFSR